MALSKPSLIDLNPVNGNKAEAERRRERLSERDSKEYAIVRPHANKKHER